MHAWVWTVGRSDGGWELCVFCVGPLDITHPATLRGRKFDLRFIVLVKSCEVHTYLPLQVVFFLLCGLIMRSTSLMSVPCVDG